MPFALIVTPAARAELVETAQWYERQKPGIGDQLLDVFDAAAASLLVFPTASSRFGRRRRKLRLDPFKNAIIFEIDCEAIVVIGIIDLRRSPTFMRRQLRSR